jgi:hypothetical protein
VSEFDDEDHREFFRLEKPGGADGCCRGRPWISARSVCRPVCGAGRPDLSLMTTSTVSARRRR